MVPTCKVFDYHIKAKLPLLNPTNHRSWRSWKPVEMSGTQIELAPKVIFLVKDPHGFGPAIFDALHPCPNSDLTREVHSLELPVAEKYNVSCDTDCCALAQFFASDRSAQVSVFLLPNFKPPVAACVIHEILRLITLDRFNEPPTLIFPYYAESQKISAEKLLHSFKKEVLLYGVEIGAATDSTQKVLAGVPRPSPALRIQFELLNCLVHLVRVLKIPAILLVGTDIHQHSATAADKECEVLCELGGFLASFAGLYFAGDKISWKETAKSQDTQEPWQALYG